MPGDSLLTIALDHLGLGRAHLSLALTLGADFREASEHLDRAVDGLREGARDDHLPRGLLARAALRRVRAARTDATAATADLDAAAKDLQEAEQIAERGSMRLHLADANLEWARWHLEKGERDDARGRLATARELVTACGYGRREGEVAELEAVLGEG